MAITDEFRTDTAIPFRLKYLVRRVEELESGEAYARMDGDRRRMQRGYEAK